MRPILQPSLVNGPFADPALFVDVLFERRARPLTLFGPAGFIEHAGHRLASYTWNLVENYGFALQEAMHVNVWPNRLAELGLVPGAWLRDAKRAFIADAPDDTPLTARWREGDKLREKRLSLGTLRQAAMQCVPGQKIACVSDVACHADNLQGIIRLVADADLLLIEATFLECDAAEARRKNHLTARQAGSIARDSRVREIVPFHFSPRYADCEAALLREARASFPGVTP